MGASPGERRGRARAGRGCFPIVASLLVGGCGRLGFEPSAALGDADASASTDALVNDVEQTIPAGTFMMGCNAALDSMCRSNEVPYHAITLSAYAIDRTEVTQAAYAACIADGACTPPSAEFDPVGKPTHPVAFVTWDQAQTYCAHVGKRLPTEAEWEKAARGTDGRTYVWGEAVPNCQHAVIGMCSNNESEPVGSYPLGASPYGVLDMCGNLWEWVADWADGAYYQTSPAVDPPGPASGVDRIMRGGYFGNNGDILRAAYRAGFAPTSGERYTGFRCARSL